MLYLHHNILNMFKENNQPELFSFTQDLPGKIQNKLSKTEESAFYNLVFRNINESDYKVLYSESASRPNTPVNILVASLILKERKGWSFDELVEHVMFDLRTKVALGLSKIDDVPYSRGTIFNFQNRLEQYKSDTDINLLETTFDNLTTSQLKKIKIKTNIQRSDSTQISSNIKNYSRIQLLIEVILRLYKKLKEDDKVNLSAKISEYDKVGSQEYVYGLKSKDLVHELEKLGEIYNHIYNKLGEAYSDNNEFRIFKRVYDEHFTEDDDSTKVKSNDELNSGMLQSPDDEDATYRKKNGKESRGTTINATETANPENKIQLVTDIDVNKNNVDDSKILENKIDKIKEKTPDLDEMHTDGGYGSKGLDEKMEDHGIKHITTAVRGRKSDVVIIINQKEEALYSVECPHQIVKSNTTKKKYKAKFDTDKCGSCPLKEKCSIFKGKGKFYFTHSDYLKNERNRNILKIPYERQKIRPNVEATMQEFKCKTNGGKLKVRGLFKTSLFAFAMGISINFGRIYKLLMSKDFNFNFYLTLIRDLIIKVGKLIYRSKMQAIKCRSDYRFHNIETSTLCEIVSF